MIIRLTLPDMPNYTTPRDTIEWDSNLRYGRLDFGPSSDYFAQK